MVPESHNQKACGGTITLVKVIIDFLYFKKTTSTICEYFWNYRYAATPSLRIGDYSLMGLPRNVTFHKSRKNASPSLYRYFKSSSFKFNEQV